jgi:hypothetical protein
LFDIKVNKKLSLPRLEKKAEKKSFQSELEKLGPLGESKYGILDIPVGSVHLRNAHSLRIHKCWTYSTWT